MDLNDVPNNIQKSSDAIFSGTAYISNLCICTYLLKLMLYAYG
jgi:hypothetical protein